MEITELLPRLLGLFALAFFSMWGAIAAGVALGIAPFLVGATAWLAYASGVVVVIVVGDALRERLMRRFARPTTADSPIRRAWDRYGLLGLSILAPITTGAQIGALLGLSLGVPARRLLIGMGLGGVVWAILFMLPLLLGTSVIAAK